MSKRSRRAWIWRYRNRNELWFQELEQQAQNLVDAFEDYNKKVSAACITLELPEFGTLEKPSKTLEQM